MTATRDPLRKSDEQRTHSWDRLPEESDEAWRAFCLYRDQDLPRNRVDAYRQYASNTAATQAAGYFTDWAKKHCWDQRVWAFDQFLENQRLKAIVKAEKEWAARQVRNREDAAEIAESFFDRAKTLMKFPAVEQVLADGKTIIRPADTKQGSMATRYYERGLNGLIKIGAIKLPDPKVEEHAGDEEGKEYLPEWLVECFRDQSDLAFTDDSEFTSDSSATNGLHPNVPLA